MLVAATAIAVAVFFYTQRPDPVRPLEPRWPSVVYAIAGDGVVGTNDGDASRARFADPFGVAVDAEGTIYISDAGESPRIRRLSRDGVVSTLAGGARGFADGVGPAARFDTPSGLAIDSSGTLYVADTANNAVRRVTREGHVSTVAGDGLAGDRDGVGRDARFNGPLGVAVDAGGRIIVADTYNDRIRIIETSGRVATLAGGREPGFVDGSFADARFDTPSGVAVDAAGNIHIADTGNNAIRMITPQGAVTTAPAFALERLIRPTGIANAPGGEIYITDDDGRIVEIDRDGQSRTVAGSTPGFRDGNDSDAQFRRPSGVAVAAPGRLIVADAGNALIRLVAARSQMELRPPSSPRIAPAFDPSMFDWTPLLWPVDPLEGPHEIAGTVGEARGDSAERFHAGIDVRVDDGTPVLAVRDGTITSPLSNGDFGSLSEWLRIGPFAYVHMRAGRGRSDQVIDPIKFVPSYNAEGRVARIRVKRGVRFTTGEVIGTVNRFNHVHLNVGWPGDEHNPLRFGLVQFHDSIPPTIPRGGIKLFDESGTILTKREKGRLLVSSRVQIVVDAWDQVDGNRPGRRLGLYSLGYRILHADGTPAPGFDTTRDTIQFDRLTSDPVAPRLIYAPGSGIPFYGRRTTRFLYVVTNTFRDGVAASGVWDTTPLAPGDYVLRVKAADISGNEAIDNRDIAITIH